MRIVIDATAVTECDRRGLATFVDSSERAGNSGVPLAMFGLPASQRQALSQLWRSSATEELCCPSLKQALAAVRATAADSHPG